MRGELAGDERPQEQAVRELEGLRERETDERRDRDISSALTEERRLELRVRAVERLVVPVEAPARLGGPNQQPEQDGAKERLVLARTRARVGAGEDGGRRLAPELLDRESRILARSQHRLALLDEGAHQRPELVQRRPAALDVLLEREGKLRTLLELAPEHDERAEDESAEERVEMRRAYGHVSGYAA